MRGKIMEMDTPSSSLPSQKNKQAKIAALEQKIVQSAAVNATLRKELKSAEADIHQSLAKPRGEPLPDVITRLIQEMAAQGLSVSAICNALGVSRATYYRHRAINSDGK